MRSICDRGDNRYENRIEMRRGATGMRKFTRSELAKINILYVGRHCGLHCSLHEWQHFFSRLILFTHTFFVCFYRNTFRHFNFSKCIFSVTFAKWTTNVDYQIKNEEDDGNDSRCLPFFRITSVFSVQYSFSNFSFSGSTAVNRWHFSTLNRKCIGLKLVCFTLKVHETHSYSFN